MSNGAELTLKSLIAAKRLSGKPLPSHSAFRVAFQASTTAEVSAVRMVDLAGYVICALIHPEGVLLYLDRGFEKASPVFEHPFHQTTSVQASMREWSSYPAGIEMGLPRNIAIELGVQHCRECPHTSQSSCFQSQELNGPRPNHEKHPHTLMLPPSNLTVGTQCSH
ncbi:hypothetical protein TNCV_2921 [Trichonephila clavipes]|nr:hypothetical protein TNCV_2921 [Trichonephila clavipes]